MPPLTGPVVDAAGLLGAGEVERLSRLARSARAREDGQGVQLQYLLVRSLEGEPIEDYSIRVAEAWKIGTRGRDNGVLVTVAVEDRAVRIEVGGGLEGGLTDVQSRGASATGSSSPPSARGASATGSTTPGRSS